MAKGRKKTIIEKVKEAEGIGDIIKIATNAIGLKTCDECEERRIKLNQMFSFIKVASRKLTLEEINKINEFNTTQRIDNLKWVFNLYNEIYRTHIQACSCPGVVAMMLEKLTRQSEYDELHYKMKEDDTE